MRANLTLCSQCVDNACQRDVACRCADCHVPEMLVADGEEAIPGAAVPLLLSPFMRLLAQMRQPAGISRVM